MGDNKVRARTMNDNSDVQEIHDGKITDMRMEMLLGYFNAGKWNTPDLDTLFNEVVHEFIDGNAPTFHLSRLLPYDCMAAQFAVTLGIEFSVTYRNGRNWPGPFAYLPDAKVAVAIFYPYSDETTSYAPGIHLNHAILSAIVQYARERSLEEYNQGTLLVN